MNFFGGDFQNTLLRTNFSSSNRFKFNEVFRRVFFTNPEVIDGSVSV
jgi:hypothetical protein